MSNFAENFDVYTMKYSISWRLLYIFSCVVSTAIVLASAIACSGSGVGNGTENEHNAASSASSKPQPASIATTIARQGRLYTSLCQVHKVVLFTDEAQLKAPLIDVTIPGDRKVAVPIDVTLKGYVDFSQISASNIEIQDSLCCITLPDPRVEITSSKIDHAAVRQYVSMTRSNFSDGDINRLAAQGEDSIASHLTAYGIVERSRESCVRTIMPMLTKMGYSEQNVVIRFRKDFNNKELRALTTQQK